MKIQALRNLIILSLFLVSTNYIMAQDIKRQKMEQLSYLVGDWIGTSKVYENGEVTKECAAYEKISYDLDQNILVIELKSEFLQLRTIVTYDEAEGIYHYHRFAKSGYAKYPAEFYDDQLIVSRDEKTRFYFCKMPNGAFREYGEALVDGKWVKTFEDNFINAQ